MSDDDLGPMGGGGQTLNGFKFIDPRKPQKTITVVAHMTGGTSAQGLPHINGEFGRWLGTDEHGATVNICTANNNAPNIAATGVDWVAVYDGKIDGSGPSSAQPLTGPLLVNGVAVEPIATMGGSAAGATPWVANGANGVECSWNGSEYVWTAIP